MAEISYTILDGAFVDAMSINDFGQVAGYNPGQHRSL
jgi:hypothetical protein